MEPSLLGGAGVENVPVDYLPVFLLLLLAIALAGAQLILSWIVGKRAPTNEVKDSPYECGIEAEGGAHTRFSVKFYLVAMLFVLFDIEVVFMYPWAVVFREQLAENLWPILGGMGGFVAILFFAYIYALKKGALQWKN